MITPPDFAMRVEAIIGGGQGRLPDGTYGETKQFDVYGALVLGSLPPPGSELLLADIDGTLTTVRTTEAGTLPDGRVHVGIEELTIRTAAGAYALASNRSLIGAVAVRAPVPGRPTAADDYADYSGQPLRYTWQPVANVDVELLVELARPPSGTEALSLESAIRRWDAKGAVDGFGTDRLLGGTGHLNGLYGDGHELGARWTGPTLRWVESFGTADRQVAMDDLARRLAGWSAAQRISIVRLTFGEPGPR